MAGAPGPKIDAASNAFRERIAEIIPVYFIQENLRQYMREYSNWLLEMASISGASIEHASIDDNCLLSWPERVWDSETEALHDVLQCRLMEHHRAVRIDEKVRQAIVRLGNMRLIEARTRGLELQHLFIGNDLLPTWRGRDSDADNDADDESTGQSPFLMDDGKSVHSCDENTTSTVVETTTHAAEVLADAADSDSESDDSLSEEGDDMSLRHFSHDEAFIPESYQRELPPRNIVHDVDVYGALPDGNPIDLEVYLVKECEDIDELPELELSINEEEFAFHYPSAYPEAVELQLEGGGGPFCLAESVEAEDGAQPELVPETTDGSTDEDSPGPVTPPSAKDDAGDCVGEVAASDWILI